MEIRCTAGLDDPRLALFCGLTDHELRRSVEAEHGIFIAESAKVVRSALAACVRPVAFLLEDRRLGQAAALIEAAGPDVPVFVLDREETSRIVGYPHNRGVLCAMERPAPRPADEVLAQAKTCAVVEAVTDTTNVGAIFRSAAALGCDAVLLTPTCADPLARRCVRVSMGSVFSVPWARTGPWPEEGVELLHGHGFTVVACALSADALELGSAAADAVEQPALLFGTEGDGLAPSTVALADRVVRIPMAHGIDSLNVAAASAVFFWQYCRR